MRATILQSALCRTSVRHRPSPSLFLFPGLSARPVWPSNLFQAHTDLLNNNFQTILNEYNQIHALRGSDYGVEEHKLHDGKWDWHSYISKGKRQTDFAVNCPKTAEILESFNSPKLMVGTPFSVSFFSTMHPHSKISAHCGPCNLRIRCHFPLIVPKSTNIADCGMRIADETFQWKVGQPVFFDDSYEHEGNQLISFVMVIINLFIFTILISVE
jgi:aspartyl/asparaginyl beta-hydroxylase (cupin superfamily)